MTATATPFGFLPVRHKGGGIIRPTELDNGIASGYAANIFCGDPVKLATTGTLQLAAATEAIDGVFIGCEYTDAAGERQIRNYWPTGTVATDIVARWYRDSNIIYAVQADATVAQTAIGAAADHIVGSGNTKSGKSTTSLDATVVAAASSAQWKIEDLYREVGNEWGDAFTILEVTINERALGNHPGNAI